MAYSFKPAYEQKLKSLFVIEKHERTLNDFIHYVALFESFANRFTDPNIQIPKKKSNNAWQKINTTVTCEHGISHH